MSRRPYSYSILRYVHDVVTGEFVNVGIVMVAPGNGTAAPRVLSAFKDQIQRLRPMFPDIDRKAFRAAIAAVRSNAGKVAKQVQKGGLFKEGDARTVATQMLPHDGSSLQWSEIGTGVAKDLDREFARITERMISNYFQHKETRRTDEEVWKPVRQALLEREVKIDLEPRVIEGEIDTVEFQHSWVNGQIHAYEPLSFDLADASNIRDKARKWRGNLDAAADGATSPFKAYFIAGKPSQLNLMDAYNSALEILRQASTSPEVYDEAEIDVLVAKIEDQVRHHRG
ncbi:DUF3037 domain-containing protein [Qipengyuania sphaerica]|uniref:DUF3037 domain-containing protein n=1 Tax=Qipengyuania sphaerica TaxID=2867243 RepID=UPI0031E990C9